MVSIKTVAVLGGSGNLGPAIVTELLSAGFSVTGVTREGSTNSTPKYPDGLPVQRVDYGSFDALKTVFDGQDAVVSVVGFPGLAGQKLAIDAAIAAGVKRFIPSEFGVNTQKARGTTIGNLLTVKIGVTDYLAEKAEANPSFTWSALTTGHFFDWALENGYYGINLKEKTAVIVDSGNEKAHSSNLAQIGRSVAGILKHPDETANKYLGTASFNAAQNEVIALVEELAGIKLTVESVKSADLHKSGQEKLAAGDPRAFSDFLREFAFAEGKGNALSEEESANALVGVPYESLRDTVTAWLKKAGVI
ncbi:hypothetical protein B0T25DRAFT_520994 [Lasiosphaeria hispida]|uniref:NmrA-like domain-containing protein n=1 Tax=Lasiosphaeria hispida TaxID=260671 RepID=A0AAJ0HBL4_9PEZI|nr:hypothetical protein B0T25DRAFT_520994 [Lasiosphaeria hispida]